jgi:serine/threonine protein phosphatase PrpC
MAVADGMGGGSYGRTASSLAISALPEQYFDAVYDSPLANLQQAVHGANRTVRAYTATTTANSPIGTTLVAAAIIGSRVYIVNMGDSRAYLIRGGQLSQLTTDHNWANQQIEQGQMSSQEAYAHKNAPLLTHVLGQHDGMPFSINGQADNKFSFAYDLQQGDVLVLCSDGMAPVPTNEMIHTVTSEPGPRAARRLVELAKTHGTSDNATAVVYQYGMPKAAGAASRGGGMLPWMFGGGVLLAVLLVVGLLAGTVLSGGGDENTATGNDGSESVAEPSPTATTASEPTDSAPLAVPADAPADEEAATPEDEPAATQEPTSPPTPTAAPTEPDNEQAAEPTDSGIPPTSTIAPTTVPPTEVPPTAVPTAVPTNVPRLLPPSPVPTAVPRLPAPVPPTAVPPTAVPTEVPTEVPSTAVPPTAVPTEVPQLAAVPSVVGMLQSPATTTLQNAGLRVSATQNGTNCFDAFKVVGQSIEAGAKVPQNTVIELSICQLVRVPDTRGMELNMAKQTLRNAGLSIGAETIVYERNEPAGTVHATVPGKGAAVGHGTAVNIQVFKRPESSGGGGGGGGGGQVEP